MELLKTAGRALACIAASIALQAHAQALSEPAVKAAFLYKFAAYVEWPASARAEAPFVFATLNADEVATELAALLPGRAVDGRPTVVRKVKEGEPLHGVHMIFIGRRNPDPKAAVKAAMEQGVLAVTETSLDHGAAINFVIADNRVAFEISLDAAEQSGHRISSRMLSVARRVIARGAT